MCSLTVHDNGIGISETMDLENADSLGLQLIQIFTEQIEGSFEIVRDKGTKFIVQFHIGEE